MRLGVLINTRAQLRSLSIIACLGACLSLSSTSAQASTAIPACATANLTLGFGERVSAMTGEHAVIYTLANNGKATCRLYGYPGVSFYDKKNHQLPFRYTRAQSQYMTHKAPTTVVLRAGTRAYFLVAKYRCDIGVATVAESIHVYPPNTKQQLVSPATPSETFGIFTYCKGGTKDPGKQINVSPVRATSRFL